MPNVRLRCATARQADFVLEGYVDPSSMRYATASPQPARPPKPGEGFKRPWPPLIRTSADVRRKIDALFGA